MISYEEALKIVLAVGSQRISGVETIDVESVAGHIAAQDVVAKIENQPFDNAGMDGYLVHSEDLTAAANNNSIELALAGRIAAGDLKAQESLKRGQCYAIMTGARMPPGGGDAVVPVEETARDDSGRIQFHSPVARGANIRRAGEDYKRDDIVIRSGKTLAARHVLALATLGISTVKVLKRPRVGLIPTGREAVDDLSAVLAPGQIYNSSRPYLTVALAAAGAEAVFSATIPDDPALFKKTLEGLMDRDIVISTGAVSAGIHDFVPSALKDKGAEILFHKVAVRPGKPILFARFPDGGPLFFGLPGNPAASAAGLRFFVQPLIRAMRGLTPECPRLAVARKSWNGKNAKDLCFFMRAKTGVNDQGVFEAEIPEGQQSFKVRPFAENDSWCLIPQDVADVKAGDKVRIYED